MFTDIINSGSGNQGMTCSLPVIEYGKELKKLEADGFVQREGGRIFLTDRGIDISNTVMTWFLQDEEEEE